MYIQHNLIFLHNDFGQHRTICGDRSFDEHL
jgi:hypothetical protein